MCVVLVHPQLPHNGFPMDGALVGVGRASGSGTTTIDHGDMIKIMFVCFCFLLLIFLCLLSPIVRLCYVVYRYRERERESLSGQLIDRAHIDELFCNFFFNHAQWVHNWPSLV